MANYIDNNDVSGVDPRLVSGTMDLYAGSANDAARTLNNYGSIMGPAERKAYETQYANSVKAASEWATKLGMAYKPPELKGPAVVDGRVPGTGTSLVVSKANDLLTTVDGYGKSLEQNLTTVGNSVKNNMLAAKNWLFNTDIAGLGSLNDIKNTTEKSMAAVNDLAGQLNSAIDKPLGQIKGMSDSVMNGAMSQLDSLNRFTSSSYTTINGVKIPGFIGSAMPAMNGLIDTYNNTKRSAESAYARFRDLPSELALRLALIDQGGQLGLSDFINHIINNDDQDNDQTYHIALIDQFDYALSNGNLDIVDQMITKLGVVTVLNRYPDAVTRILRSFRFATGTKAADYPAARAHLIATLTSLDANWLYTKATTQGQVVNMAVFQGASDAVVKAFGTDKYYNRLILAVKHYTAAANGSLVSLAKQMYPYSAISA